MSAFAAFAWMFVLTGNRGGLDKNGFALTLAGECPLIGAWGTSRTEPPLRASAWAAEGFARE